MAMATNEKDVFEVGDTFNSLQEVEKRVALFQKHHFVQHSLQKVDTNGWLYFKSIILCNYTKGVPAQ